MISTQLSKEIFSKTLKGKNRANVHVLIRINIDVADPDDFCTSTDSMLRNRRRNFHLFLESDHPFSFLTSREIFIVKEDLPLVLLKLYRNNIIIIFASKRFTLTCSTWHMKHKSQFISNKSTSGPLDWELNEEGLYIFLVLLEGSRG